MNGTCQGLQGGEAGKKKERPEPGRASGSKEAGEAPHYPQQTPASREGWEVEHALHRAQEGGSVQGSSPGSNRQNRGASQRAGRKKLPAQEAEEASLSVQGWEKSF